MRKDYSFILILFLILLLSFLLVIFISNKSDIYLSLKNKMENGDKEHEVNDKIAFHIDSLNYSKEKNELYIRGWAIIPERNSNDLEIQIILKSDTDFYLLSTTAQIRKDVTAHFNDGNNYDNSGFEAVISTEKINKGEYVIEVVVCDNDQKYVKETKKRITILNQYALF